MGIAFPALLILLLALPGIIFRYFYRRGFWNTPVDFTTVPEEIVVGSIIAAPIHAVWIPLVSFLFGDTVDFESIFLFVTGQIAAKQEILARSSSFIASSPSVILRYFLGIYLFALALGYLAHFVVRRLHLDLQFPFFSFDNDWYYLFKGEKFAQQLSGQAIPSRSEIDAVLRDIAGAYVTVVVEQAEQAYIYRGIVDDFFFDRQGNLDRFVLLQAHRRVLGADRDTEVPEAPIPEGDHSRYYPILGNFLVVQYKHVKTLNIEYFKLERVE